MSNRFGPQRDRGLIPTILLIALGAVAICPAVAQKRSSPYHPESLPVLTFGEISKAYEKDKNISRMRAQLIAYAELNPSDSRPLFQLALLARAEENWAAALGWMERYLQLDSKSELAGKVRREIRYLKWAIAYDKTSDGRQRRDARHFAALAREAFARSDWQKAGYLADAAMRNKATSWEMAAIKGISSVKQDQYTLGEFYLMMSLSLSPPPKEQPLLQDALDRCRKARDLADLRGAADQNATNRKYQAASDGYLKAWKMAPERYDLPIAAIQCLVLAENYSAAKVILKQVYETQPDLTKLPVGLRQSDVLLAKLDKLSAFAPKKVAANSSAKRKKTTASSGGSGGKKKSMAQDFLSRIKKK